MLKEIKDFPDYAVDETGKVWSKRKHRLYELKLDNSSGYSRVHLLNSNGIRYNFLVHRLVLETFVGPCPYGMECCHENGITTDNRLTNIRWDTHSNNYKDRIKHGTDNSGENNGRCKLSDKDIIDIMNALSNGIPQTRMVVKYNVSKQLISAIKNKIVRRSLYKQ